MARRWMPLAALILGLAILPAAASTVIGLSVEDQARLSDYVVIGEVIGQRGQNHPQNGIETAVTLKVTDVLKGDLRSNRALVFHTRGGEVDGVISEALGEATFSKGQKVLVFLESIDGRLYNLGLSMGVWSVQEDDAGSVTLTRALTDGLTVVGDEPVEVGPLTFSDMSERVSYAVRQPRFDSVILREARGQGR